MKRYIIIILPVVVCLLLNIVVFADELNIETVPAPEVGGDTGASGGGDPPNEGAEMIEIVIPASFAELVQEPAQSTAEPSAPDKLSQVPSAKEGLTYSLVVDSSFPTNIELDSNFMLFIVLGLGVIAGGIFGLAFMNKWQPGV